MITSSVGVGLFLVLADNEGKHHVGLLISIDLLCWCKRLNIEIVDVWVMGTYFIFLEGGGGVGAKL